MKNKFLLLCGLFLMNFVVGSHKIVFLISPPRSLSTAFLRMMQARGDFSVMNEPELSMFIKERHPELFEAWNRPENCQSFEDLKTTVLKKAQTQNVFVKGISFMLKDFLLNDFELMHNPNVYFVFLIRNPHAVAVSFYEASKTIFHITGPQFSDLYGYEAAHAILETVKKEGANPPYVISAEDLSICPQETVEKFCHHVGIPYKPESLAWDSLGDDFSGQAWHEPKKKEALYRWHQDAITSRGFHTPGTYEVDAQGQPTFSEITTIEHRAVCKKAYLAQLRYYDLLLQHKN